MQLLPDFGFGIAHLSPVDLWCIALGMSSLWISMGILTNCAMPMLGCTEQEQSCADAGAFLFWHDVRGPRCAQEEAWGAEGDGGPDGVPGGGGGGAAGRGGRRSGAAGPLAQGRQPVAAAAPLDERHRHPGPPRCGAPSCILSVWQVPRPGPDYLVVNIRIIFISVACFQSAWARYV